MTPIVNLYILEEKFSKLTKAVYFDSTLLEFSEKTLVAIKHVIENEYVYPERLVRRFVQHVWDVVKFVRGSRTIEAPYETLYVLQKALNDWIPEGAIIGNAAQEEMRFFLNTGDLWEFIANEFEKFNLNGFQSLKNYRPLFVRMGSPEAFKHRPLFSIPLFHELGHFVDHHYEISASTFLLEPAFANITVEEDRNYRREFFADLFAACYCGESVYECLHVASPTTGKSKTHPSTNQRGSIINDFLNLRNNSMITLLNDSCSKFAGRELSLRLNSPNIVNSFDDNVSYHIKSDEELFGLFNSGWKYFHDQIEKRTAPWIAKTATPHDIEKKINQLAEESIRKYEIRERRNS